MAVDCTSLSEAEVKIEHDIETDANADIIDIDPDEQASLDIPDAEIEAYIAEREEVEKKGKPKF